MENIKDCCVDAVQTKGKFMFWQFSNGWYVFNTFGMSGQWSPIKGKHPCFVFQHASVNEDQSPKEIFFNDPRHFGTIKFANNKLELNQKLSELGWDPLQHGINESNLGWIKNKLNISNKCIAEVLMNQKIFAGVGNYIRAESLYLSKMSPWKISNTLTSSEIENLCRSVVYVMNESSKYQGATIHTYKDAYGKEGRYSSQFKVYGQKQDPMNFKVKKENTPDGRAIHWCPEIQK